jgi:hypothetical protein
MSAQRSSNSGDGNYTASGKAAAQRRAGAPVAGEYAKNLVKSHSENVLGSGGMEQGAYAGSTFGKAAAAGRSRSQHTMTETRRFTHYRDATNIHQPMHANSRGNLRKAPGCRVDSVPRSGQLPWEKRHWADRKDHMYAPPRPSLSRHGGSSNNGMSTVRTRWGGQVDMRPDDASQYQDSETRTVARSSKSRRSSPRSSPTASLAYPDDDTRSMAPSVGAGGLNSHRSYATSVASNYYSAAQLPPAHHAAPSLSGNYARRAAGSHMSPSQLHGHRTEMDKLKDAGAINISSSWE